VSTEVAGVANTEVGGVVSTEEPGGVSAEEIVFIRVVLPEPLGPTRLLIPGGMRSDTRLTPNTSP